jgi:hypothetical protein
MWNTIAGHVWVAKKRRLRASDRVPIMPISRAEFPGQQIKMDVIDEIHPPSAQGHRYCLCIVDSCTRWPWVYPLKSLTARVVCIALCDLFAQVGVASVVTSDRGTNFTSRFTKEFLKRMGCTPRFNTPGHPEARGMVECWNSTFKNMLHHVIQENQRQWHKSIPFRTWAMRECSNTTTGASPYLLMYGPGDHWLF